MTMQHHISNARKGAMGDLNWQDGASAVGILGGFATAWKWITGRIEKRYAEKNGIELRLSTLETKVPEIHSDVQEIKGDVKALTRLMIARSTGVPVEYRDVVGLPIQDEEEV